MSSMVTNFTAQQKYKKQKIKTTDFTAADEVQTLLSRMHHEEPYLPSTEAVLRCHAKRKLYKSFNQAAHPIIADWLFSHADQPFHNSLSIKPSFTLSLPIRALYISSNCIPINECIEKNQQHQQFQLPGRDLLFVPVAILNVPLQSNSSQTKQCLIGYTFGSGIQQDLSTLSCPFGNPQSVFIPHSIGRFSFDLSKKGDLLIAMHGLINGFTGIMHITGNLDEDFFKNFCIQQLEKQKDQIIGYRSRTFYLVPGANYGYRRLPGRILSMLKVPECKLKSEPKYQFPTDSFNQGVNEQNKKYNLVEGMAKLEKLLKGTYQSKNSCRDAMDPKNGQVIDRMTFEATVDFDIDNAIAVNVFKNLAVRSFYQYMSRTSNLSFIPPSVQPNTTQQPHPQQQQQQQ